jgi:hypothetical protein
MARCGNDLGVCSQNKPLSFQEVQANHRRVGGSHAVRRSGSRCFRAAYKLRLVKLMAGERPS